jgi:hypothetical protein
MGDVHECCLLCDMLMPMHSNYMLYTLRKGTRYLYWHRHAARNLESLARGARERERGILEAHSL